MTDSNSEPKPKPEEPGPVRTAWKNFGIAILEPWTVVLGLATAILFFISQTPPAPAANAFVQLLLAVSSGVLGGRVANRISALAGEGILKARGKVAVRSLKLLLRNTASLEARVSAFLRDRNQISNPEIGVRNYEEVINICRLLQEETASSIENWTDIVPEADISTAIGLISELRASLDSKEGELTTLQDSLSEAQEKQQADAAEIAGWSDMVREKIKELSEVRSQLQVANSRLTVAAPGTVIPLSGIGQLVSASMKAGPQPAFRIGDLGKIVADENRDGRK